MLIEFLDPDFSFKDSRGFLVQLVHNGWKQINVTRSSTSTVRGGHYHIQNTEAFYVISGRFELILECVISKIKEHYILKEGQFFCIKPYILHSFRFLEETILVVLYNANIEQDNGEKDIFQIDTE